MKVEPEQLLRDQKKVEGLSLPLIEKPNDDGRVRGSPEIDI